MKKPKEPKEPKEKKEKKPKKEKPPKEKKPKKPKKGQAPEEGEEGAKKKKKKPKILLLIPLVVIIAAVLIVVFVILPGRNSEDEPDDVEVSVAPLPPSLPPDFQVGDETVVGMTLDADESEAKAALTQVVYTYTDLADAGKAAETYVNQLAAANPRFYVVDEDFVRTDKPDFTTPEGTVLMARNIVVEKPEPSAAPVESEAGGGEQDGEASAQPTQTPAPSQPPVAEEPSRVLAVKMEWSKGQCVVTADQEEGEVTSRPASQQGSSGGGMSQRAAKEYLESLEPAQLGLTGSSMDDYEVMVVDGIVLVNGEPCTKLNIYDKDYVFMGCYLVAKSGQDLYQFDTVTGTITVMKMP